MGEWNTIMDKEFLKPDDTVKPLIHTLKIAVFQCEPAKDGKITFINIAGSEILGYSSNDEVLGNPFCELFSDANDFTKWFTILEEEGTQVDFETFFKRKTGKNHAIGLTCALIKDAENNNIRIDGIMRDIHSTGKGMIIKEVIANINKTLVSNLNMKEVDHIICDELYRIIEWDRVSIVLLENKGDVVVNFVLTRGKGKNEPLSRTMPEKSHYPLIGSILEKVVRSGKPFIVSDTSTSEIETDKLYANAGIKSRLAYPLEYKNNIIGSINFGCSKLNYYNEEHIKLLKNIAPSLAFGIENTKLYERALKAEKGYKALSETVDNPWG